jgi:hypothetical protein
MALEVGAGAVGCFTILAGKYRDALVRQCGVVESHTNGGTHLSSRAAANRIDDEHRRAWLGERRVDFFGGARFLNACAGQLFAHWNDHNLWVHCCLRQGVIACSSILPGMEAGRICFEIAM